MFIGQKEEGLILLLFKEIYTTGINENAKRKMQNAK